ncbi:hypothetical protein MtrunA17_Chr6g0451271 [Medicago truncatula]|uniref:Uncharacterized protein n=1 Tax=Medicago truncatula TaxID=3880 RepID=A0A396HB60_MEDTR|nr:hypothetical protein MtrunA17_Chr6g0451271 [Medicago truncatula]
MDILVTASWKSLWMEWCISLVKRALMGFVDHMLLLDTRLYFDEICVCHLEKNFRVFINSRVRT